MAQSTVPQTIAAVVARTWWKTLMANACALVEDAAALAERESYGRARSLVVLGMEELAKARWLYEAGQYEWSKPLGLYGRVPESAADVVIPDQLRTTRRPHAEKLKTAERFASGLGGFWDEDRRSEYYFPDDLDVFEEMAKQRNLDKQAGLYVDREQCAISSPLDIGSEGIHQLIQHAAQVLEMHLIEDHTRQQDTPDPDQIDSSQDLHYGDILALAHPEEFAAAFGPFEDDDGEGTAGADLVVQSNQLRCRTTSWRWLATPAIYSAALYKRRSAGLL